MTIDEAKNLKITTTKDLLGSLITREHTLERDHKEKEVDKKKKKDPALQLLISDVEDDDGVTSFPKKAKRVFWKISGALKR